MATVTVRAGEFRSLPPTKQDYTRALTLDSGPPYVYIGEGGGDSDDRAILLLGSGLGGQTGAMAVDNRAGSVTAVVSYTDISDLSQGSGNAQAAPLYRDVAVEFGADKTGVLDSTTSFNLALAAGPIQIPAGTYKINGVVAALPDRDIVGAGSGSTKLKLGAGGQLKIGDRLVDSSAIGGFVGGFKLDCQSVQNVAGGALYVGFCLKKKFADIYITDTAGDGIVIETAQNCTWDTIQVDNAGRSCVVFDYGAGGHIFYNPELNPLGRHAIEFRQTGQSVGGYPTFLGPSNNIFYGGIAEYGDATSTQPLVYHGAGTNNQAYGLSVCPTGRTVNASAILMEAAANAVTTTCTVTSGSATFTVADATGITPLMTCRAPGFPAGSVVAGVAGNVITMFRPASASGSGAATFGASSGAFCLDGLVSPGSDTYTYGIEMKGNCSITLSGRSTFTNHIAAFRTFSNDRVTVTGPVSYFGSTIPWASHPSDDSGTAGSEDMCIRGGVGAGLDVIAAKSSTARQATFQRGDQTHPNVVIYPGDIRLSDGTVDPVNTGIARYADADGLEYAYVFSQLRTPFVKLTGAAGATVDTRLFGRRTSAGPPTSGTWAVGDQVIDSGGSVWLCTAAGTPGTWSSGSRPTYVAPSYSANVGNYALGDSFGSSKGADNRVLMRGALITSAAFAANATLATITAAHRPSSAIVLGTGVKCDSVGVMTGVPILVDSMGAVQCKVALGSGDALFMDGFSFHAA